MKVYERLAEAFAAEGVTAVFGMMGHGNETWMDALDRLGVTLFEVRHEGAGLGMADGWSRVNHEVSVVSATQGPGLSQLATALITASRAGSPVIAFVGEFAADDPDHHQRLNQSRFAEACESGFVRVATPDGADDAVRKAFYLARTESRPVVLSAPIDVQAMAYDGTEPYVPARSLIADGVAHPHGAAIEAAAELIANSRRPVIVVGRGARWAGAGEAVLALADRIGALISTTLMAKTWLARDPFQVGIAGLYSTRAAMRLFEDADCVIGIGASMNRHTVMHGYLFPGARYIHIEAQPHVPISHGRAADVFVHADARLGTEALEAALDVRSIRNEGYRTDVTREALVDAYVDPQDYAIEPDRMDPREVCRILDELIPGSIPLAMGSGAEAGFSTMTFQRERPFVLAGTFYGCIGQMMPAALGAVAGTGLPITCVDGDASVIMHLAEFETAVRYGWPILIVVQNNEALGSEYYTLQKKGLNTDLALIPTPDLGVVARAFGGDGRLVCAADELREAVTSWVDDPRPMMIDVRISREVVSIIDRRKRGEDA